MVGLPWLPGLVVLAALITACGPAHPGDDRAPGADAGPPSVSPLTGRLSILPPRSLLIMGAADTLTVVGRGTAVPEDVIWELEDTSVASIRLLDEQRVEVTGVREGLTLLRVSSPSWPGLRADVPVQVRPPVPYPPIPPSALAREGLRYSARLVAAPSPPGARPGTSFVTGEVVVANPTASAREIRLPPCHVWLTGHSSGFYYGEEVHMEPAAWDSRRLGRSTCSDDPRVLELEPGGSDTLRFSFSGDETLGDSLREASYNVHAHLALAADTVVLSAGAIDLEFGEKELALSIETGVSRFDGQPTLRARATLRNADRQGLRISHGTCALQLRAYRGPAREGEPVWRSARVLPWEGTSYYGCPGSLHYAEADPGEVFNPGGFGLHLPLIEVVGDSLPDGRYFFEGVLTVDGDTLEAPAGDAVLEMARPPLPSSRTYRVVTLSADTEVIEQRPSTIQLRVVALRTQRGSARTEISRSCPVMLLAYRSPGARDAAPRSGAPAAKLPQRCGSDMREIVFRGPALHAPPGTTEGEPVAFRLTATAGQALGDSLPDGRYYFAAAVPMQGRTVYLAAGEAVLRSR